MMRAYSLLETKSIDAERREFAGWATTPELDRVGDVVVPDGAKFRNPVALLLHHDHRQPIGTVVLERPTAEGIRFRARIPEVTEASPLRDRVNEAWSSVKSGVLRAVSIGFRALEGGVQHTSTGLRFTSYELLELSLVAIPAQPGATIDAQTIKRYDITAPSVPRPVRVVKLNPDAPPKITADLDRRIRDLKGKRNSLLREWQGAIEGFDYIRSVACENAIVGIDQLLAKLEAQRTGLLVFGKDPRLARCASSPSGRRPC
jgi:HK97 family phage prohead protease